MSGERLARYRARHQFVHQMLTRKQRTRYAEVGDEIHHLLSQRFDTPMEGYFVLVTLKKYFEQLYGFREPEQSNE